MDFCRTTKILREGCYFCWCVLQFIFFGFRQTHGGKQLKMRITSIHVSCFFKSKQSKKIVF